MPYDKWIDVDLSKQNSPHEYDLCDFVTHDGKVKRGWRTGNHFDGSKIIDTDKMVKFKKVLEYGGWCGIFNK